MAEQGSEEMDNPPSASMEPVDAMEVDANAKPDNISSEVADEQWRSMMDVVMAIYNIREEDGHDPSRLFQRSVNKRYVPDYYDVIKEPMALSVLKQKINKRAYHTFAEFVRDCALIPHNAQTYNRPESQAYKDALVVKDVFISEFKKLVEEDIITPDIAELPDLGEIPEADPLPAEDEEDEEDEDEEDDEDSDEETGRRRKKRGPRSSAARREGARDSQKNENDPELRKKRGRPPRVDTPMEARIKAVLKGIRKFKDSSGQLKVRHFERLPDKAAYPDYFQEIKEPMAIDLIKRKSKRKKYQSVDHFMRDMGLMFNNAKSYNHPESQLYKDACDLQVEAHNLADQEKKKPDSEYLMEDGRLPLPNGILYKGELWKVGDWIHLQNPNDVAKPIVAQIYRTWQDVEGQQWVNACWYYRPEQTVHQFEKHFYPNEVVKTGQYRDHRIDEVVDRCFVMFVTRYNRGRPRGLAADKEVYVCEARYNEEKHKLNKIKTWASCLPDEVREKDYEMDLFDAPVKIKKIPSPIKHLLRDDAKETDDIPKPTWGAENAPPVVGSVHRRPREENDSPPPEPTPSPPPAPPQPAMPARPGSMNRPPTRQSMDSQGDINMGGSTPAPGPGPMPVRSPAHVPSVQAATPQTNYHQPSIPPTPAHQPAYANRPVPYTPQSPRATAMYQQPPQVAAPYTAPQHSYSPYPSNRIPAGIPSTGYSPNPNGPRPVEVYTLSEAANAAIPVEERNRYQQDSHGRVLFWTQPPLDPVAPVQQGLGHSVRYLAAVEAHREERNKWMAEKKRKYFLQMKEKEELQKKKQKKKEDNHDALVSETMSILSARMEAATNRLYEPFGERAAEVRAEDEERWRKRLVDHQAKLKRDAEWREKHVIKREDFDY